MNTNMNMDTNMNTNTNMNMDMNTNMDNDTIEKRGLRPCYNSKKILNSEKITKLLNIKKTKDNEIDKKSIEKNKPKESKIDMGLIYKKIENYVNGHYKYIQYNNNVKGFASDCSDTGSDYELYD